MVVSFVELRWRTHRSHQYLIQAEDQLLIAAGSKEGPVSLWKVNPFLDHK